MFSFYFTIFHGLFVCAIFQYTRVPGWMDGWMVRYVWWKKHLSVFYLSSYNIDCVKKRFILHRETFFGHLRLRLVFGLYVKRFMCTRQKLCTSFSRYIFWTIHMINEIALKILCRSHHNTQCTEKPPFVPCM